MLSCTTTRISDGRDTQITTNLFLIEQRDFLKTFSLGGALAKLPPGRGEGRNLERGRDCSARNRRGQCIGTYRQSGEEESRHPSGSTTANRKANSRRVLSRCPI